MADTEQRLKALEKRIRVHNEQIQALFGDAKALSIIVDSIGAALGANNKLSLESVILSLRRFEKFCRVQNEHDLTIARLRKTRKFFESRLNKAAGGESPPSNSEAPRRRK